MTTLSTEKPSHFYARVAGVLYLLIITLGISSEIFIRGNLIVPDNANTTAQNILAAEGLFRFGFVADSIMLFCDVAIAILFYLLFRPVDKMLSLMAAAFRGTQAAILGFNLLNYYAAVLILKGEVFKTVFDAEQLNTLAMLFLNLHSHGYDLGLLFFGLSSIILGYLIIRADYFPEVFGYGLIAAALVYLAGSFMRFLVPGSTVLIEPFYIIPVVAELSFCLWLLLKGIKVQQT